MFDVWIMLFLLLSGGRAFMIHNTQRMLCLEDSAATGEVLLKKCNLDSEYQQWVWFAQGMLMCVASSRCLSAQQTDQVQTWSCQGSEVDVAGLMWDCNRDRLISRNTSMLLSLHGKHLILTYDSKYSKWRSLDEGDICQEKLRFRRASDDPDEFEVAEEQAGKMAAMTEEQREYLHWYYRTEDSTTWKFVLLGLAFICLLVGFLLLGMGAMANKNRKKIANYKVAASLAQKSGDDELHIISPLRDDSSKPPPSSPDRLLLGNKPSSSNGEVNELRAGNIVVTWKDGNTSCLYSNPEAQEEEQEGKQEEEQEEKPEVVSAAEL
ncbi:solute carrier family 51 subunit beta isoform X2 [Xiphias gladius]|nr:solute carrier family 51 subunit beta isoform X2 [Xiphias gladius]XP_039988752.1 solute carrier family 51 subunit beta isoform X2 [Xiphias gladius]XP_039988761.1 solute carrier family 51 subunit beta isoform X2 [Xiphias gladius]XP_039988770.1 solute carrier family 51 subunit beta isoform X2 [Xiphias gladius]XP_039988778.1 solute carrier family 51 subunit beta isoform X2 [Xiphias gladius]XP_039988789.1 solute carrier family 51 subunit beta isoform X2 [Xiphias gladius]XP_039988798.1 solute c